MTPERKMYLQLKLDRLRAELKGFQKATHIYKTLRKQTLKDIMEVREELKE